MLGMLWWGCLGKPRTSSDAPYHVGAHLDSRKEGRSHQAGLPGEQETQQLEALTTEGTGWCIHLVWPPWQDLSISPLHRTLSFISGLLSHPSFYSPGCGMRRGN